MGSVAMSPGGQCSEDKRKTCGRDASPDTAWHATLKSIEREKMSILAQPHNPPYRKIGGTNSELAPGVHVLCGGSDGIH